MEPAPDTSWVHEVDIRKDYTTDDGKHDIRWYLPWRFACCVAFGALGFGLGMFLRAVFG